MTADWQAEAACRGYDPNIWFPGQGGDVKLPKSICAACPVIDPCLEHALLNEVCGVWGGVTERGRRVIRQRRGIRVIRPEVAARTTVCGTMAAYKRHLREGTKPCNVCRRSNADRSAEGKARAAKKRAVAV